MEKEPSQATTGKSAIDPCSFKLLLSCPSGLAPSQVSVEFSDAYDRIPHPDIELENTISEIWEQRIQKNKSLYNGKKFRYGGCTLQAGGEPDREPHDFCGDKFRSFVGKVPGSMRSPLGNGAVVETIDKKIIVLKRSNNVGEFPGHFVFPGGHPEPQEIGIDCHQGVKELTESINKEVSQEMFDSIVREVVEEIGVPASSLSTPAFIGISRRDLNVRPTAFFFIKCSLDSKEVQQFYSSAQDGYESTQLYAVPMIDLENMTSKMPGCHRGGFALYKSMVDTGKIT